MLGVRVARVGKGRRGFAQKLEELTLVVRERHMVVHHVEALPFHGLHGRALVPLLCVLGGGGGCERAPALAAAGERDPAAG